MFQLQMMKIITIKEEIILAMYTDWIDELEQEDSQMMGMLMYDMFVKQVKFPKTCAAKEVACCLGISTGTLDHGERFL